MIAFLLSSLLGVSGAEREGPIANISVSVLNDDGAIAGHVWIGFSNPSDGDVRLVITSVYINLREDSARGASPVMTNGECHPLRALLVPSRQRAGVMIPNGLAEGCVPTDDAELAVTFVDASTCGEKPHRSSFIRYVSLPMPRDKRAASDGSNRRKCGKGDTVRYEVRYTPATTQHTSAP